MACMTGDVSLCEAVFTADVVCTSPILSATSRDDLETQLSSRADALGDIDLSLARVVDEAEVAFAEWRVSAEHRQPYVVPGDTNPDPAGRRAELSGVTVAEFKATRISSIRNYFDRAALLQVLGATE